MLTPTYPLTSSEKSILTSPSVLFAGGGVVGVWYDPSDLTTLFQDSAGTIPVTADGDPVGLMKDKSGNNYHAVQATAGNRPVYKTNGTYSWIQLTSASSQYMTHTVPSPGANDYLAVFAHDLVAGTSQGAPFINWGAGLNTSYPGVAMLYRGTSAPTYTLQTFGASTTTNGGLFSTTSYNAPRIDSILRTSLYLNGNQLTPYQNNIPDGADLTNNTYRYVFCRYTFQRTDYYNGKFYGGIYLQGATTKQQRQIAQYYLKAKSGIYCT